MAQVKLLLLDAEGIPTESTQADDITFNSFTVSGGNQVLSVTGLALGDTNVQDVANIVFADPSTGTINQTAGAVIVDNLMAKERQNVMTTAGEILFPQVANSAGELDNFRVPSVSGAPSATPSNAGTGFMVFDAVGQDLYIWNGSAWQSQSTVEDANRVANMYTAGENIDTAEAVYISAASTVSLAQADDNTTSRLVGFAKASAVSGNSVTVVSEGVLPGFSGLTPGARYYLSEATPGAITNTVPTGSGQTIVMCGYSKSATELHIHIEQLGRRS